MPFVINVKYDSSVNSAPASFKTVVNSVVQFFENHFDVPLTITIGVGYGEVDGQPLSSAALGQSLYYLDSFSYTQIRAALALRATTTDDLTALASLPAVSPANGTFWLSQAEAKALGLLAGSSGLDGYIGFAASSKFTYNPGHGAPAAGRYDFFGAVAHEISEVMGRFLLVGKTVGSTPSGYSLLDLFHYSAAGQRDFAGTQAGYFSINKGVTHLANFNTNPSGDFGDWAASAGNDAFRAFSAPGVVNAVSSTDLRELDILGWNPTTSVSVTAKGSVSINGASAGVNIGHAGSNTLDGGLLSHGHEAGGGAAQFVFRSPIDGAADYSRAHLDKIEKVHAIFAAMPADPPWAPRDAHASAAGSAHFSADHILDYGPAGAPLHNAEGAGRAGHLHLPASDFLFA
jgi:hypothetical protein